MPLEPAAEAVESGKQHAFGDVGLIELVADFPFKPSWNDDTAEQVGVSREPSTVSPGSKAWTSGLHPGTPAAPILTPIPLVTHSSARLQLDRGTG